MIMQIPPKESNLQKGLAGRGMGMLVRLTQTGEQRVKS